MQSAGLSAVRAARYVPDIVSLNPGYARYDHPVKTHFAADEGTGNHTDGKRVCNWNSLSSKSPSSRP